MRAHMLVATIVAALSLSACSMTLPATDAEWKAWLASIPVLFVVMWLASAANALMQLSGARTNGTPMTCAAYLAHWPESAATIIMNILAFALLIVTDQLPDSAPVGLKFLAVVGIGFGANQIADKFTKGGRSKALTTAPEQR